MTPKNYDSADTQRQYQNFLNRGGQHEGPRKTTRTIFSLARYDPVVAAVNAPVTGATHSQVANSGIFGADIDPQVSDTHEAIFDLNAYRPNSTLASMPPREFAGPQLGNARLFPKDAISLFTALGGAGKTSSLLAMAAHIAAGKNWGHEPITQRRVIMFFVEEDQKELDRKFGATTHDWDPKDRTAAADNLRVISLTGRNPHLTRRTREGVFGSPFVDHILQACLEFGAELIVMDHLQGFADGDLNLSDTATALAMEATKLYANTGAAVVFTAHVNKSNRDAEVVDAGFTSGSLAFENAARQVTGVIKLPPADATKFQIPDPDRYVKLSIPKNSYGPAGEDAYMEKEYVPAFHTVRMVPYYPPAASSDMFSSAEERLRHKILQHIEDHPGTTKNQLEGLSGKKGRLGASKADVRRSIEELLAAKTLVLQPIDVETKDRLNLPQQTKTVLRIADKPWPPS